jgi:hypothetical protein
MVVRRVATNSVITYSDVMKLRHERKRVPITEDARGLRAFGLAPVVDSQGLHEWGFYTELEFAKSRVEEWQRRLRFKYVILEFEV